MCLMHQSLYHYRVEVEEWRKGQPKATMPFSWVKTVTVKVDGKVIQMGQGPSLVVDGQEVTNYIDGFRLRIVMANSRVVRQYKIR